MLLQNARRPFLYVFVANFRACLNFIGEIYYSAIFERNEADSFCIAGTTEKKSNEVAAKNSHKKPGE